MRLDKSEKSGLLFLLGAVFYFLCVGWINFHGLQWYNFDMYADARVAQLMSEQHSIFPDGWIFGNQYYVIATPALAAVLNLFCHSITLAMSLATTVMYALILLGFFWCGKELFTTFAQRVGLFCMAGATILGDSVSSCTYGFQILYSMASYYACYVVGILLHLGIWVRLLKGKRVSAAIVFTAWVVSLALGIQSPRETLSLSIPLLLITALQCARKKGAVEKRSFCFSIGSMGFNLVGLILNTLAKTRWGHNFTSNVSTIRFSLKPEELLARLRETTQAFLDITGLRYLSYSWKWKPIAILGGVLLLITVIALIKWIRRHDDDPAGIPLVFCWISLICVFGAGIFVLRVRAIYFFVWYLLVPFSIAYLIGNLSEKQNALLCSLVLLCGMANFVFNFYPDFSRYTLQKDYYDRIVSWLDEREITTVYGDYQAPTISACSRGSIRYSSVFPNINASDPENDGLLLPNGSPAEIRDYRNIDPDHAVLILSDSPYDEASGWRYMQTNAPEVYKENFEKQFTLEECFESPYVTYYVYSFTDSWLFQPDTIP